MRIPKRKIYRIYWTLIHALAIVGLIGLIATLSSCRSPQKLFEVAQKRGLKVECKTDTVKVIDSVLIDGETKYFTRDSIVYQPFTNVVTKWETKYKYKTIRDSFEVVKYQTKWKVKEVKAQEKTKQKESRSNWWKWFIGGIAFSVVVLIAWKTFKVYVNPTQLFK